MRLIDADKLIEDILNSMPTGSARGVFRAFIEQQPTAFDVDKVVEQLENKKFSAFMTLANTGNEHLDMIYENVGNCIDETIKLIKAGGIDEKN